MCSILFVVCGDVENIGAACRMYFASLSKFRNSRAILSPPRILTKKSSKAEKQFTDTTGFSLYFLSSLSLPSLPLSLSLSLPLLFLLSWVESIKARTPNGVPGTQFLQNFGPFRANFRPILFQIDWITGEYVPLNYFNAPFKKRIKGSRSLALRRLASKIR